MFSFVYTQRRCIFVSVYVCLYVHIGGRTWHKPEKMAQQDWVYGKFTKDKFNASLDVFSRGTMAHVKDLVAFATIAFGYVNQLCGKGKGGGRGGAKVLDIHCKLLQPKSKFAIKLLHVHYSEHVFTLVKL